MIRCESLKDISETLYFKQTGIISTNPSIVIPVAAKSIFDFDYELFDETYKNIFESKIIKHYYFRNICTDSYDKWKLWLNSKLNEIMPYYNQLYRSATLELNPLYNFVIDVEHKDSGGDTLESLTKSNKDGSIGETKQNQKSESKNGEDVTNTNTTNKNINKYNDTPQGRLDDIESGKYLTEATIVNDTNTGTNTIKYGSKNDIEYKEVTTGKNVENEVTNKNDKLVTDRQYTEKVMGRKDASGADLLLKFRETFLNIDMMIIEELNELFESIYHVDTEWW